MTSGQASLSSLFLATVYIHVNPRQDKHRCLTCYQMNHLPRHILLQGCKVQVCDMWKVTWLINVRFEDCETIPVSVCQCYQIVKKRYCSC